MHILVCRMNLAQRTAVVSPTALRTASSDPCHVTVLWAAAVTTAAPVTRTHPYSTNQTQVFYFCMLLVKCIKIVLATLLYFSSSLIFRLCWFGQPSDDLLPKQPSADLVHDP